MPNDTEASGACYQERGAKAGGATTTASAEGSTPVGDLAVGVGGEDKDPALELAAQVAAK